MEMWVARARSARVVAMTEPPISQAAKPYFIASAVAAGVAGLAFAALGKGPGLAPFLGRFHPLVVHLPIGVLVLAVTLELLALRSSSVKAKVEPAMPAVLSFLVASGVVALVLGMLLGQDAGDYSAKLLGRHRLITFVSVILACAALATHGAQDGTPALRALYRGVLALTLGAMSLGGHLGGGLSRGENYLYELAPSFVQRVAGYTPKKAEPTTAPVATPGADAKVFADVVQPALIKRCGSCHGEKKQKADLRVDSLAALLKGGETGPAIVPFSAKKSLIHERMTLPKTSDDYMPPDDKPGLTPDELAALEFWLDRGASPELTVAAALTPAAPEAARPALERAARGAVPAGVTGDAGPDADAGARD